MNRTLLCMFRTVAGSSSYITRHHRVWTTAGIFLAATTAALGEKLLLTSTQHHCPSTDKRLFSGETMAETGGYTYKFPRPAVTVDALIFAYEQGEPTTKTYVQLIDRLISL